MAGGIIRYDDMLGPIQGATGVSALTTEAYRDTAFLMSFFRHSQVDAINLTFQFCHRKKLGSSLASIHIHCIPMANPAAPQNVYYSYSYSWQKINGSEYPLSASWTSGNSTMTVGTTDAFKHKIHSIVTNVSAPASEGYSSILLIRLARFGTSPNDTYTTNKATPPGTASANLGLLSVDCHYQTERRGSILEATDA